MYDLQGRIKLISEPQTFSSGFVKREFVVTTSEKFPQDVKFEVTKERCALLDAFKAGDEVVVGFVIRGNEYKERYYVNLNALRVQKPGDDGNSKFYEDAALPREDAAKSDDDLPF